MAWDLEADVVVVGSGVVIAFPLRSSTWSPVTVGAFWSNDCEKGLPLFQVPASPCASTARTRQ